jgi:hypothetical protein
MKTVRIATTKTGQQYVVNQVDFRTDRVHCWGEVQAWAGSERRGLVTLTHEEAKAFPLTEVTLTEVPRTIALADKLLKQTLAARLAAGRTQVVRGHGRSPEQTIQRGLHRPKAACACPLCGGSMETGQEACNACWAEMHGEPNPDLHV